MPVDPALYNPNIPQGTDQLSVSQPQLLNNFGAIMSLVDQNHYDFATGSSLAGKHKWVTLPAQAATPPVGAFTGNEVGLYSFVNATTTVNELYVNKSDGTQVPITAFANTPGTANIGTGWTYWPSGLLVKWGRGQTTSGTAIVNPSQGPTYTNIFWVGITTISLTNPATDDSLVQLSSITPGSPPRFNVASLTTSKNFAYFVIGN